MNNQLLEQGIVLENIQLNESIYSITIQSPEIALNAQPGQFVTLYSGKDVFFRRPFSICNCDKDSINIIYRVIGKGTKYLTSLQTGSNIEINGPLGNPFPDFTESTIFLIGGGIGLPPLFFSAKKNKLNNNTIYFFAGYRTVDDLFLKEELKNNSDKLFISSDDGSVGKKGIITDIFQKTIIEIKNNNKKNIILSCGPIPMLEAVQNIALKFKIEAYISVEEVMGCGFGICLGCAVKYKNENDSNCYKHACKDGPVFKADKIHLSKNYG